MREAVRALACGPYANVVDLRKVGYVGADARAASAAPDPNIVATAIVIGSTIQRWLAERWIGENAPQRPIGVFDTSEEALQWAERRFEVWRSSENQ